MLNFHSKEKLLTWQAFVAEPGESHFSLVMLEQPHQGSECSCQTEPGFLSEGTVSRVRGTLPKMEPYSIWSRLSQVSYFKTKPLLNFPSQVF